MFDKKTMEDLSQKLFDSLPKSIQQLDKELKEQFKQILNATFAKMDLVTRDEFDIQTKVLARTREKLDYLQKQVDALLQKEKE